MSISIPPCACAWAEALVSRNDRDRAAQVAAAEAYLVTPDVLGHILGTFPLVSITERHAVADRYVSERRR